MQRVVLLLFAFVMFAHAEMTIKQDLSVSAESETTKYRSLVRVSGSEALLNLKTLTLADKNDIIKTYNAINAFLGKNSICKGGSFSIEPLYENKNGARMQVGFESQYSLECVFSEIQNSEFQRILRTIESEVGKNKYLSLGVSRIEKVLDEQALEILTEQLNARLLEFALQKAKEYSNLSHRKCNVKSI